MNEDQEMVRKLSLRIVQAQLILDEDIPSSKGVCLNCPNNPREAEKCSQYCAIGKDYAWVQNIKPILNGGVGTQ